MIGCQIFEDGAAYQERMKNMAHDIVKFHYKEVIFPNIDFCHNSDQSEEIIANNIKNLIHESLFLQGPPDVQVSLPIMAEQPHQMLYKTGPLRKLRTRCNFRSSQTILL